MRVALGDAVTGALVLFCDVVVQEPEGPRGLYEVVEGLYLLRNDVVPTRTCGLVDEGDHIAWGPTKLAAEAPIALV